MVFCYVVYSTGISHVMRNCATKRVSRKSMPPMMANDPSSMARPRSVVFTPTSDNGIFVGQQLTTQLTTDKSLMMFAAFRSTVAPDLTPTPAVVPTTPALVPTTPSVSANDLTGNTHPTLAETAHSPSRRTSNLTPTTSVMRKSAITTRTGSSSGAVKHQRTSMRRNRFTVLDNNERLMINPDCYVQILMDYVIEQLNLDRSLKYDLCDETGKLLELYRLQPYTNGKQKMEARKSYYLVEYDVDEKGRYKYVEPLFRASSPIESAVMAKVSQVNTMVMAIADNDSQMRSQTRNAKGKGGKRSSDRSSKISEMVDKGGNE